MDLTKRLNCGIILVWSQEQKEVQMQARALTSERFRQLTGKEPRAGQLDAVQHLVELAESGKRVIALEAPPGTGKSVIAAAFVGELGRRAAVSTFTKQLQWQYRRETGWPYLMGRANYICPVTRAPAETAPCVQGMACTERCQFKAARERARQASRCVLNHALLYTFVRFADPLATRPLVVLDECQRCADAFASCFSLTPEEFNQASELMERYNVRSRNSLVKSGLAGNEYALVSRYLSAKEMAAQFPDCYSNLTLTDPRPSVQIFPQYSTVLLMSATVPPFVKAQAHVVEIPSPFPVESRPLIVAPLARLNRVNYVAYVPQIVAVARLLARRGPGIIHTHNTEAAQLIAGQLRVQGVRAYVAVGKHRGEVIKKFLRDVGAAALVGPGLSEGIDAVNVQWQLIPKVLWPDVTEQGFLPHEQEAAIRVAQAYGRAPRLPDQRCVTIVLDEAYHIVKAYLPRFVTEAVVRLTYDELVSLLTSETSARILVKPNAR